jgi:hypothetical protein
MIVYQLLRVNNIELDKIVTAHGKMKKTDRGRPWLIARYYYDIRLEVLGKNNMKSLVRVADRPTVPHPVSAESSPLHKGGYKTEARLNII